MMCVFVSSQISECASFLYKYMDACVFPMHTQAELEKLSVVWPSARKEYCYIMPLFI